MSEVVYKIVHKKCNFKDKGIVQSIGTGFVLLDVNN